MIPNHDRTNSCCKMRFASRFLRALSKMRKPTRSLISSNEIRKRSHRIKMAAYSSMAHAVGSRRAWSRAILIKLGSRARHHHVLTSMMRISKRSIWLGKKRVIRKYCPSPSAPPDHLHHQLSQENKLRKIVPGGKSMDICSLLEETAHFVRCLNTQVTIMQTIADHYSK